MTGPPVPPQDTSPLPQNIRSLYPFQSRFAQLRAGRIHYVDEGQGAPVIMVHGNPTWSFFYRNLIQPCREKCRAIAFDHIGCGLSDKPSNATYGYTLAQRIQDMEEFVEQLELKEKVTLVMHDWGGMIGMGYAVRRPDSVSRLVVMNTAAFHKPREKKLPWQLWLARNTRLGHLLILRFNAFCRGTARIGCAMHRMDPAVRKGYLYPYDSPQNRVAVLQFVKDIPLRPGDTSYELVSEIQEKLALFADIPMMICWGDKDIVFDRSFLNEWVKRFPDAQVHRFLKAGHYLLEDEPDECARLILRFICDDL